jgi:hypothetical protein
VEGKFYMYIVLLLFYNSYPLFLYAVIIDMYVRSILVDRRRIWIAKYFIHIQLLLHKKGHEL